jgi:hypothetical protein
MKWLDRLEALENQKGAGGLPTKPTKPGSVGFVGTGRGPFQGLDAFDPPPAGHAPEWRRWFNLVLQHKGELGHPPAFAARLAYGEALTVWHLQSGAKPDPRCCAGCGCPVAHPVHTLPDGALVCPTDACLIAHGEKWRAVAAAGLAALGIAPPEGWQL